MEAVAGEGLRAPASACLRAKRLGVRGVGVFVPYITTCTPSTTYPSTNHPPTHPPTNPPTHPTCMAMMHMRAS